MTNTPQISEPHAAVRRRPRTSARDSGKVVAKVASFGAALALLGGCASSAPSRNVLGARSVALDLAYSDDALKVPVTPSIVYQFEPALLLPTEFPGFLESNPRRPLPPLVNPVSCPKAAKNAVAEEPATVAFAVKPVAGTYLARNVGTIKLSGPIPVTLPYPEMSELVVRDVNSVDAKDSNGKTVRTTTYVIEDRVAPTFKITSTYSYDAAVLNLVKEVIDNNGTLTTFHPTPAIEVFAFAGPGATWTGSGTDIDTFNTRLVRGAIGAPETIDVCGQLIEAQKASTDVNQVDVPGAGQSGSRPTQPIITHYATQYGGLPVRREIHQTTVVRTAKGPVPIDTDVVSTLMSIKPVKK